MHIKIHNAYSYNLVYKNAEMQDKNVIVTDVFHINVTVKTIIPQTL